MLGKLVGIHHGAMVTPSGRAMDKEVAAVVSAYVTERHWWERLVPARRHDVPA
jgi:hypothetical protein